MDRRSRISILVGQALRDLSAGYNADCWPLYDYGEKDSDLLPEGCSGIKAVEYIGGCVNVTYGCHKTFTDPTREWDLSKEDKEYYSSMAQEIVNGCSIPGEWSGDDWLFGYTHTIPVVLVLSRNGEISFEGTAQKIIEVVEERLQDAWREFRRAHQLMNNLYEELYAKYEGA